MESSPSPQETELVQRLKEAGSVESRDVVEAITTNDVDAATPFVIASAEGTMIYPGNGESMPPWLEARLSNIRPSQSDIDVSSLNGGSSEQPIPLRPAVEGERA